MFRNLDAVLADVGSSLPDALQLTTYLVGTSNIDAYVAKRDELFPKIFGDTYPPNALVVVTALARDYLLIEVQAVAAITRA